jgi:multiple sugar transport system ATP-binding protein
MGTVTLEGLTKVYPGGTLAVQEFDLEIADGEFMVLVGPSGCGKTTVLRMVAGLEDITAGRVCINGTVVNDQNPRERDIAMVFQNYALYPHMTVAENIGFALNLRKVPKRERQQKVQEAARILGLSEHLQRKPAQLSGGQRQRVAMGRAIVRQPAAFLMDEPLSNLDAKLRVQMRAEIMRLQRRIGVATMYVTHDQTEAMTMGDRVAVLRDGHLQQVAPPQVLYDHPANTFVAGFIGSPAMNMYRASLSEDGAAVRLGQQSIPLPGALRAERSLEPHRGREVIVGIRPEHLHDAALAPAGGEGSALLEGEVDVIESLGSEKLVHFRIDAQRHRADEVLDPSDTQAGAELGTAGELGAAMMSEGVARVAPASRIRAGERTAFAVEVERLALFDADDGHVIRPQQQDGHEPPPVTEARQPAARPR